jgi:hypothetical protein
VFVVVVGVVTLGRMMAALPIRIGAGQDLLYADARSAHRSGIQRRNAQIFSAGFPFDFLQMRRLRQNNGRLQCTGETVLNWQA